MLLTVIDYISFCSSSMVITSKRCKKLFRGGPTEVPPPVFDETGKKPSHGRVNNRERLTTFNGTFVFLRKNQKASILKRNWRTQEKAYAKSIWRTCRLAGTQKRTRK